LAPYLFDAIQKFVDRCARRTHTPTNIFDPHSLSDVALRAALAEGKDSLLPDGGRALLARPER
jgi:hypothetical protein